jgi:hypothetical protein
MKISKADWNEVQRLRSISRAQPSDVTSLRNLYEKYVNVRLKKTIDWSCPSCIRAVRDELINFQSTAEIEDEVKDNTGN